MSQPYAYSPPPQHLPPPPAAPRRPWYRRARVLAPAALLVGFGLGSAGKAAPATDAGPAAASTVTATKTVAAGKAMTPAKPAPATSKAAPAAMPDDGTYVVGSDVAPGTYRAPGGDACYWARLKDTDGALSSVIANGLGEGRKVITIAKSDAAFETRGCGPWTRS